MTTSAATVESNYLSAITALQLVVTDVQDASTGILGTETLAAGLSAYERSVLAEAAKNCGLALELLNKSEIKAQLANL